jgi:hypothetical protein
MIKIKGKNLLAPKINKAMVYSFILTDDFLMEGTLVSSNNLTSKRVSYPVSTTGLT